MTDHDTDDSPLTGHLGDAFATAERAMGGVLAVRASRLDGSEAVSYRANDVASAASTIKVYLLGALLDDVAQGRITLDHEVVLEKADQVTGSGVLKALGPGRSYTMLDLATLMIIVSDNTATNLIMTAVGLDRFRAWIARYGWSDTTAAGKLQVPRDGPPSTTSARDLHDVMRRLWSGELLPESETAVARRILEAQQQTTALGRDLDFDPYSTESGESDLVIASKGGAIRGVRNEVAVIQQDGNAFVIAVTTRDCPDARFHVDNAGLRAVSTVTRVLFNHYLAAGQDA
ncbi:MAG: class A beta-lactamase-related serine hydrolase [Thioalkalivibrio sp.]|nr:class A beta-lactamase-related serine hydrolase [Thioalkalivibrio sp.]